MVIKSLFFNALKAFFGFWVEKLDWLCYTLPISSFVRQLKNSPRALSLGVALFLVAGAFLAQIPVKPSISGANEGILGGPVALAAPKASMDISSMNTVIGAGDPAGSVRASQPAALVVELSTATLDGARISKVNQGSGVGNRLALSQDAQPTAKAVAALAAKEAAKTAASRYFIQPTSGYNWGVLHDYNAVDIANSCGTSVVAAAGGTVVEDPGLGSGVSGWNGGYGYFVLVKHPNGTKTRYAHLSKIVVTIGEQVEQGQKIGEIGNTGHVQGVTGCHLHFEVIGASNPFVRG